jgi:dCTP deaminase
MILSNISIHDALDAKWLVIEPEPKPRMFQSGQDCPYQTTAVDLALGNEISFFNPDETHPMTIDLRKGKFADLFVPHSRSVTITEQQPFMLEPRQLVLAKTREKVTFPLLCDKDKCCLAARVEGKSSFARCGLLVHFTAPTIHAGFSGTITLELINFGILTIGLYPGMPICQLIVEQVHGIPFRNDSQFQNQNLAGGTASSNLHP